MSDLIVYLPNHGYADDTSIWVSWLNGVYYIDDPDQHSFKLTVGADGDNVEYSESIIDGYVRQVDTSSGTTTISGLEHLEGENVYLVSGGEIIGYYTVSDGAITVENDVYNYQVGKAYNWKVRAMRFAVPGGPTVQTRIKKISEASVRYIKSKGGQAGQEYNNIEYLTNLNASYSERSQDSSKLAQGGFNENGFLLIKGTQPSPFTVLASVIEVEVWEK